MMGMGICRTQPKRQTRSSYAKAVTAVTLGALIVALSPHHVSASNSCSALDSDEQYNQPLQLWKSKRVQRVPFAEMTPSRMTNFMRHRRPVVIVGAYADSNLTEGVNDEEWGWEGMKRKFGHVELKTVVRTAEYSSKCQDTGLCEGRNTTVAELFDEYFLNRQCGEKQQTHKVPYPHDLSLEQTLPGMFDVYQKPSFFVENLLLPLREGIDHWPSLFFGATGTMTGLHVDNFGTSFTMAVFRGRKQFMLIDPKDGPKLCMDRPNTRLFYGVGKDPFNPDFKRCPSAKQVVALFADVKAGDVLFVPGSYHHAARNLEDGVGISQNFITAYDYPSVLESTFGYHANIKLQREMQQGQEPTGLTMDLLAIRDLFSLLPDGGVFDSSSEKHWWNATESRLEYYERVMRYMESVVKTALDPMKAATRLAYFVNRRTTIAALKAIGAWDCLEARGGREIVEKEPSSADVIALEMWERLENAFKLNSDESCQSIYQTFLGKSMSLINKAKESLEKELRTKGVLSHPN